MKLTRALPLLLLAEGAASACPACLGQPDTSGLGSYVLVGALILLPFVVSLFAIRAISKI